MTASPRLSPPRPVAASPRPALPLSPPRPHVPVALLLLALAMASCSRDPQASNTIRLSGNIELTQVDIAFKTPGKLVELNVREGDTVTRGQVIARLDQEQLLHQRDRFRAVLASAESALTQLSTAIEYQTATVEGQIQQRQAELQQAEAQLSELLAGSRPQEVEQARAAVAAAQTEFDQAQNDWQRAQTLYKNEDISAADRDRFQARYESTRAALQQAKQRLALVEEGPRKEDIEAARAQVARAKAALRLAEASRIDLRRTQQETASRRAAIDQARADLAVIETQLKDTVVASPIDGVVLTKSAELGEVVNTGTTVVTVGDRDHPWVRAYINERDLGRVKLNAQAHVTTDSFPGKVYSGRVSFISSEAEFTPKQIQTAEERVKLVYRVKIEVENPNHELKSNMPADAEIVL